MHLSFFFGSNNEVPGFTIPNSTKDPNGILLKMTDPNLRKIFSKIELSLTHLAGILEKVHDNKHEIGPLLENINVVLKDVKGITGKLNRMELFEKREKKQEPIKFEIDN